MQTALSRRSAMLFGLLAAASAIACGPTRVNVATASTQTGDRPATFCNPIDLQDLVATPPVRGESAISETSDPAVVFFEGEYWAFTARGGRYWHSPDLVAWQEVEATGLPSVVAAPSVAVIDGRLHFVASGVRGLYATDDPLQGAWKKVADTVAYVDPALFVDDDGRLYVYHGSAERGPLSAVALDPANGFKVVRGPVDCISGDADGRGWEVYGEQNHGGPYRGRLRYDPWVEGAAMSKHAGRYYLQYAAPSSDSYTSAQGVFVADDPLGPFAYAPYGPFTHKPTGFMAGAGLGSTFADAGGRLWRASDVAISLAEGRDRRLAFYPAAFLPDGQMAAVTYLGDFPQYVPGVAAEPIEDNSPGWMLLSYRKQARASSKRDGFPAENAFDENAHTRWSAASGRAGEWLHVDLGKRCRIEAVQIAFAGPDSEAEGVPRNAAFGWYLEASENAENWSRLVERHDRVRVARHDYVQLERPVLARHLRLVNAPTAGGGRFAVSEMRVFGSGLGKAPSEVRGVAASRDATDPRRVRVSWAPAKEADFHIVRYGIAADRLFNNYQVYDVNYLELGTLNVGVPYFVSVDAVNDSGVTHGRTVISVQ